MKLFTRECGTLKTAGCVCMLQVVGRTGRCVDEKKGFVKSLIKYRSD